MTGRTNFTEIAKKAGVSVATVSRAMNNTGAVKEETRRRIMQIAHELGLWDGVNYGEADTSKLIGVVFPVLHDHFYSGLMRGIDSETRRRGARTLAAASHNEPSEYKALLQDLSKAGMDGLIVLMPESNDAVSNYLESLSLPVLFLSHPGAVKTRHNSIWFDNYQGAYAATEHLIGHGYKELGIITGTEGFFDAQERERGFADALKAHGLKLRPELVVQQDFWIEGGRQGFSRLMSQRKKPEAIFCCNDMMAIGAIEEARVMQIAVPEDVAIMGFDHVELSNLVLPRLSSVHVPTHEIGVRAVRRILETLAELPPERLAISEQVSTGLVVRESCGCKSSR